MRYIILLTVVALFVWAGATVAVWPQPVLPFGCDQTYIDASGADTGECE